MPLPQKLVVVFVHVVVAAVLKQVYEFEASSVLNLLILVEEKTVGGAVELDDGLIMN